MRVMSGFTVRKDTDKRISGTKWYGRAASCGSRLDEIPAGGNAPIADHSLVTVTAYTAGIVGVYIANLFFWRCWVRK